MSSRTLVVPATTSEIEVALTIISPTDFDWHKQAVENLARFPHFWDDGMRVNAAASYLQIFANPANLTLDVNGEGVLAFYRVPNGTRAILYGVSWGRDAMRIPTARREAAKMALLLLGVQRIEGITREDNRMSRKAMEASGMRYCGRLPEALWYNGKAINGVWYELDRGLDYDLTEL